MKRFVLIFGAIIISLSAFGAEEFSDRVMFVRSFDVSSMSLDKACPVEIMVTFDSMGMADGVMIDMGKDLIVTTPKAPTLTSTTINVSGDIEMRLVRDQNVQSSKGLLGLSFHGPDACPAMHYREQRLRLGRRMFELRK